MGRQSFYSNTQGKRNVGRPRNTWRREIDADQLHGEYMDETVGSSNKYAGLA